MKQILFYDAENKSYHGGILLDDEDIVCACCGGLIEHDEPGIRIVKEYKDWIDFTEAVVDVDDIIADQKETREKNE